MGLKDRKKLMNSKFPKFGDGMEGGIGGFSSLMANVNPYIAAASFAANAVSDAINAVPSVNDLFSDAGTSTGYVNGMAYQSVNDIDSDQYIKDYKKEAIFKPWRFFGLGKTRKRLA